MLLHSLHLKVRLSWKLCHLGYYSIPNNSPVILVIELLYIRDEMIDVNCGGVWGNGTNAIIIIYIIY